MNLRTRLIKASLISAVIFAYLLAVASDWVMFRIMNLRGSYNFVDLYTVFTSAECFEKIGNLVYDMDPNRPLCFYPYGHHLLNVINFLGMQPKWIIWYGVVNFLLVLSILLWMSLGGRDFGIAKALFSFLIIFSPPIWLLLERGNIDGLMLCLVTAAAVLFLKEKNIAGIIIIGASVLVKFYTFPVLIFLFLIMKKKIEKFTIASLVLVITPEVLNDIVIRDLQEPGSIAFGASEITFIINAMLSNLGLSTFEINIKSGHIFGILTSFTVSYFIYSKRFKDVEVMKITNFQQWNILFNLYSLTFISCFFAGMNYDYRLIFCVTAVFCLLNLNPNLFHDKIFMVSSFTSIWFSCFSFGLSNRNFLTLQWLGALSLFIVVGYLLAQLFKSNLQHVAVLTYRKKGMVRFNRA